MMVNRKSNVGKNRSSSGAAVSRIIFTMELQIIFTLSPIWIRALSMVPSGNSRTPCACLHETTGRKGRRPFTVFFTIPSLSRKTTSRENLIQNVWMALHRAIHRPSFFSRLSRPISPRSLGKKPAASFKSEAMIVSFETLSALTTYPFLAAILKTISAS